jgi:tRNA(adenine34) deaminase
MRQALECARRSMAAGGPPVGACLVRDGAVLAAAQNAVIQDLDVTAHAEMGVLRAACRAERTLVLTGCDLYVTVEPCAMCLTAAFYAGVRGIYFGAPVRALQAITGHELAVQATALFGTVAAAPTLTGGILAADCIELLTVWGQQFAGGTG